MERVAEILEAINAYFQDGGNPLHADALLLEDDTTVKDGIAQCLEIVNRCIR